MQYTLNIKRSIKKLWIYWKKRVAKRKKKKLKNFSVTLMFKKLFCKETVVLILTLLTAVNYFIDFSNFILLLFFIFAVLFFLNGKVLFGIFSILIYAYFFKTYVENGTGAVFCISFVFLNLFLTAIFSQVFKKLLKSVKIDTDYAVFFSLFFINLTYVLIPGFFFKSYYFFTKIVNLTQPILRL